MKKQKNTRTSCNIFGIDTLFDTQLFVNPHVERDTSITTSNCKQDKKVECPECGADMEWVKSKSRVKSKSVRLNKTIEGLELHCNSCGYHIPWKVRIRVPKGHRSE